MSAIYLISQILLPFFPNDGRRTIMGSKAFLGMPDRFNGLASGADRFEKLHHQPCGSWMACCDIRFIHLGKDGMPHSASRCSNSDASQFKESENR